MLTWQNERNDLSDQERQDERQRKGSLCSSISWLITQTSDRWWPDSSASGTEIKPWHHPHPHPRHEEERWAFMLPVGTELKHSPDVIIIPSADADRHAGKWAHFFIVSHYQASRWLQPSVLRRGRTGMSLCNTNPPSTSSSLLKHTHSHTMQEFRLSSKSFTPNCASQDKIIKAELCRNIRKRRWMLGF